MTTSHQRVSNLRSQIADWNDLSLAVQLAALEVWATHGRDAAALYCLGA